MCHGCWQEAGAPTIDTPAVRDAARLIAKVYEFSCVGGGLHVYLDDYNLEDEYLPIVRYTGHDADSSPEEIAIEEACAIALNALNEKERFAACALYDEFWKAER